MYDSGAAPNHILPSCIVVVVGPRRLIYCASVVVADRTSTGVAIIVVRKNTIRNFMRVARRSVASKVHIELYGVQLPLHLPPRSLQSVVGLATSTTVSSILSTLSASLMLLHWHEICHGLLDRERIHHLCYVGGAL